MCDVILFGNGSICPVVSRCGKSYTGGFARTNRQQNQYLLTSVAVRKVADRKSVFFACIRKKNGVKSIKYQLVLMVYMLPQCGNF